MLGIDVKRGVASTLERVFNASGNQFDKLEVLWSGKTAGIIHRRTARAVNAKVLFPALDETTVVSKETFNNLIGYALHELGHAWFTDNEPWDIARNSHGSFVSNLINGLEDPRIELAVIQSGRAPNARALFENLVNSILRRDGYVKPDDKKNIPFLLAVEGRRLNGYQVIEPSIVDASPWAADIRWALKEAHVARDTKTIVKIALDLFKRLQDKPQGDPQDEPQDGQDGQPEDGQDGEPQDGPQGSEEGEGQGEGEDGSEGDSDGPANGPDNGFADGPDGNPGDSSDSGNPGDSGNTGNPGESGKPTDEGGAKGSGKADESFDGGREVEPSSFIEDEIGKHNANPISRYRPAVGKPYFETFDWR